MTRFVVASVCSVTTARALALVLRDSPSLCLRLMFHPVSLPLPRCCVHAFAWLLVIAAASAVQDEHAGPFKRVFPPLDEDVEASAYYPFFTQRGRARRGGQDPVQVSAANRLTWDFLRFLREQQTLS